MKGKRKAEEGETPPKKKAKVEEKEQTKKLFLENGRS
jgi:hypothetical protein